MPERKKKIAILTLGCRVNQSESSVIEGTLLNHGASIVSLDETPDFCIINTCTVTGKSDSSSRYLIRRAARTGAKVIVTGCFSQLEPDEVRKLKGVCEVVPIGDKDKIVSHVLGYNADPIYSLHDRARPYLKVQDGCNFSCTYCAVPRARGKSRSLHMSDVLKRASEIELMGYNEIVLTGIHLGSYGHDLSPRISLARLIKGILSSTSLFRIRLSSIEINEIDDELIELITDHRICKHLHLPLQSGSDSILARMNRNYTVQTYNKKISRLSAISPDIAFGTDIIVGFPGETHEDFVLTRNMLHELPFSYIHTFPYSPRNGTVAADLKPQIPDKLISERAESIKELSRAKRKAFASSQTNKTLAAIAEAEDARGYTNVTTSNYLKVEIMGSKLNRGSIVFIRSIAAHGDCLQGVMIS